MCNKHCIEFVKANVTAKEVKGKRILESGAQNVNGTVRDVIEALGPAEYIGTDIVPGSCVDIVCDAVDLVKTFGPDSFDMVVSTEMLEHAQYWREVISNFKQVLKPGGVIYLTTRSKGFPYHGFPADYWRYEPSDMHNIFIDFESVYAIQDPYEPGVFVKATKPSTFREIDLRGYHLFAIAKDGRREMYGNAPLSPFTGVPGWESLGDQGLLYRLAMEVPEDGRIVEIGGEYGMSASIFCKGAPDSAEIITIDLFPGDLLSEHRSNLASAGYADRSEQIVGDSSDVGETWDTGPIDLLFVDGDHNYAGVKADINAWMEHVKPGGIVAFHDVAFTADDNIAVTPEQNGNANHYLHYDVSRAVAEWLATKPGFTFVERVDTTGVFRRDAAKVAPKAVKTTKAPAKK